MDWKALVLLALEAVLAFWLLWRAGLLDTRSRLWLGIALLGAAFLLRALCLNYETLDYKDFLSRWVSFYRDNLGFRSIAYPLGNYNIPYMYFLCLFSYLPIRDLYLIKMLSIFFDVLLAWGGMKLLSTVSEKKNALFACFFVILFLPTVILNGALWGQCDSIYTALALIGLYYGMKDRPVLSALFFTLSFGFKLQAVFLLPMMAVLWFKGKYKLRHFALMPLFYVLLVLPAVLLGKPFLETLTLYASQTGSIGDGLNYNSPSIYAIFWRVQDQQAAATLGIAGAFTYLAVLLLLSFVKRRSLTDRALLALAVLMVVGIPFLLPHMHDRYFFPADVMTVVLAFALPLGALTAPLTQFASLLGYHAYLKMRYLLYMNHGSRALIAVLLITAGLLARELTPPVPAAAAPKPRKK